MSASPQPLEAQGRKGNKKGELVPFLDANLRNELDWIGTGCNEARATPPEKGEVWQRLRTKCPAKFDPAIVDFGGPSSSLFFPDMPPLECLDS